MVGKKTTQGNHMLFKIIRVLLVLVSAYEMGRFALPKLLAYDVSVKTFTYFGEVLPVNGTLFMYLTGVVELLIALLLLGSLIMFKNPKLQNKMQLAGFSLLLVTMLTAIGMEQFVRPQPVAFLMTIALSLCAISIANMIYLVKFKKVVHV